MFYDPRATLRPDGLGHNPWNALIGPRPIGWVSTIDAKGSVNLAPFSYFNAIAADPPMLMYAPNARSTGEPKDSYLNVLEVPEFVAHAVTYDLRDAMNLTSFEFPRGVDEMKEAGLTAVPSTNVRPPRIAEAPIAIECEVFQTLELPAGSDGRASHLVLGRAVGIHIDDRYLREGKVDTAALRLIARLGYFDYAVTERVFALARPKR